MDIVRIISHSNEAFRDRQEAGRLLADELKYLSGKETVVLGIPRGGVIVAAEVSRVLNAKLDIVLSRKLGAPYNPELAIGAVTEDGKVFLNETLASQAGADKGYIESEKARQLLEIKVRIKRFRKIKQKIPLKGKTVIVTDDGAATGATMQAALIALRQEKPAKLIAALPVAAGEAVELLADYADEVIALRVPDYLGAIGAFYLDFSQSSDEEVLGILKDG
ncbi:MAG: phosphoribosyltransferase family protein [Candidatus Omnitrophica bacterium]|nr:phosphoribosyltransferase family protein [Candidatus Omnitrophota bacterium]